MAAERVFTLSALHSPPDNLYLYIAYPADRYSLTAARLDEGRDGEYLFLAVPRRIDNVVVAGLARVGSRSGTALEPGALAEFRFTAGRDNVGKTASAVNDDPRSAVKLEVYYGGCMGDLGLSWEERNIGDYSNNGLVEIADLTPVGVHFGKSVEGPEADWLELVDGNLDGAITVADITPIGQNFLKHIDGFHVYSALEPNLEPGDYHLREDLSVTRDYMLHEFASPTYLKKRLYYSSGTNEVDTLPGYEYATHFYVRAYAQDGEVITEGPPSNTEDIYGPPREPIDWDPEVGLISTNPMPGGIQISFGKATDLNLDYQPEMYYFLSYYETDTGVLGTTRTWFTPDELGKDPPLIYFLGGLSPGEEYKLLVQARFEYIGPDYYETGNNDWMQAKVPHDDQWSYYRGSPSRTGTNLLALLADPVVVERTVELPGGPPTGFSQPLLGDGEWGVYGSPGQQPFKIYLATGVVEPMGYHQAGNAFYAALSGSKLVYSDGVYLDWAEYDDSNYDFWGITNDAVSPLALGGVCYSVNSRGDSLCLNMDWPNAVWEWESGFPATPGGVLAAAADSESLYYVADQELVKLDLLNGSERGNTTLPYPAGGKSLALDPQGGFLYCSVRKGTDTDNSAMVRFSTYSFSSFKQYPAPPSHISTASPCLVLQHDPPLVLVATYGIDDGSGLLTAFNLTDDTVYWQAALGQRRARSISCGAERVFLITSDGLCLVLDLEGNLRQQVALADPATELALAGRYGLVAGAELEILSTAETDPPPYYPGSEEGIATLTAGDSELTVIWHPAEDIQSETVRYAVFYSDVEPVEFDEPRTHTTVVTDVPIGSTTYTIAGLTNGTPYWVGVRAYDGIWDVDQNAESNTEVLTATPVP